MQVRRIRVQIETSRLRVTGVLQLPTEGYRSRTTDYLNSMDSGFFALTEAEVEGMSGEAPAIHDFVAVGTRHVVALVELEDLGVAEEEDARLIPGIGGVSVPPPGTEPA